jgi:hypothetical protein
MQIRSNVFETNSSSSHSFTCKVETEGKLEVIVPDKMGNITLNGGDFSEAEFFIRTALQKANAIAVYCEVTGNNVVRSMLEEVLTKQTGAEKVITNVRLVGPDRNSYLSSEFLSKLSEALGSKRDIKNFVFNPESEISAVFGYDG